MITSEIRRWIVLGLCVAALCLLFALLTMCNGRNADRGRIQTEAATGRALDNVAHETPIIRQEQQEKQSEVDRIEGADERLPDGFASELERVRRGEQRRNP